MNLLNTHLENEISNLLFDRYQRYARSLEGTIIFLKAGGKTISLMPVEYSGLNEGHCGVVIEVAKGGGSVHTKLYHKTDRDLKSRLILDVKLALYFLMGYHIV